MNIRGFLLDSYCKSFKIKAQLFKYTELTSEGFLLGGQIYRLITCASVSLLQCWTGLQAAGGQVAAADEEAVPYWGGPLRSAALPPGGLHLHPQTQVKSWLQEARSLETLVPVKTQDHLPLRYRCTGFTRPYFSGLFIGFCFIISTWLLVDLKTMGYWTQSQRWQDM